MEGELPEESLAAFGGDGDDLMLALACRAVNGDVAEDSESAEAAFAQARGAETASEEFLVDDEWKEVEAEPEPVEAHASGNNGNGHREEPAEGQQSLFSWTEFPGLHRGRLWPGNRHSLRDGTAGPSPRPCPCSSGRSPPRRSAKRSRWARDVRP